MARKKNNPAAGPDGPAEDRLKFRGLDLPINAVLLIAIVSLVLYMWTLRAPFVFDDIHTIVNNPYITSLEHAPEYILRSPETATRIEHTGWRPLWYLSFALNYRFGGLDPLIYHVTNLSLHFMNSVLVYLITLRLLRDRSKKPWLAALFAGLAFAAHPLHTESVSYIVGRSALMSAIFYLLAIYAYDVFRDRGWRLMMAVAGLSFCLAALSKENAVTLPLMVVIYDLSLKPAKGRPIAGFAFLAALAAAYTALRFHIGYMGPAPVAPRGFLDHWLTEAYVVPQYILKVFAPFSLNIDPDVREITSLADPRFYLSVGVLAALFYGLYRLYAKDRLAGFFCLWFFVALIPETVMPITDFMAEHRTYLPLAGPAIVFGYLLERLSVAGLSGSTAGARHVLGPIAALTAIFALCAGTVERNKVYASETALWEDTAGKSPGKSRPQMGLAVAYWKEGRLDEAVRHMRRAIELEPDNPYPHYNLSLVLKEKGDKEQALKENLAAVELMPDEPYILTGLGALYGDLGMDDKALDIFNKVIQTQPDFPTVHYNLGSYYIKRGKPEDAVKELKAAISLAPHDVESHNNLASAYISMGKYDLALAECREALRLAPNYPFAHFNAAGVLEKLGDTKAAAGHYRLYLQYSPKTHDRKEIERKIEKLSE